MEKLIWGYFNSNLTSPIFVVDNYTFQLNSFFCYFFWLMDVHRGIYSENLCFGSDLHDFPCLFTSQPFNFSCSIFDSLRLVMILRYWAVKAIVPSFVQTEMIIWTGHHDDNLYTEADKGRGLRGIYLFYLFDFKVYLSCHGRHS